MSRSLTRAPTALELRTRAVTRLAGSSGGVGASRSISAALAVLHELASSPATAGDALALLHELQVHQVELDMQTEEMRNSRAELDEALAYQLARIDAAPVGLLTVDAASVVQEVNATGAQLLGLVADELPGLPLTQFLVPHDADMLVTLLTMAGRGGAEAGCPLRLLTRSGVAVAVLVTARRLRDHDHYQLAVMRVAA